MPKGIHNSRRGPIPVKQIEACERCEFLFCVGVESPGCGYAKLLRRWNGADYSSRSEYHRVYYQITREKKLAAAKKRRSWNKHQRYYHKHKKDPEWYARRQAANNAAARRYREKKLAAAKGRKR